MRDYNWGNISRDNLTHLPESIEAGGSIKTKIGIISLFGGIRAKTLSCLRVAAGLNTKTGMLIEAELIKGEIILGLLAPANPLSATKWYWHIHHEVLVERSTEPIENRIQYIKTYKPADEIETRLRLLHEVQDIDTLTQAMNTDDKELLETLHQKECPGCPWNGKTIFPPHAL